MCYSEMYKKLKELSKNMFLNVDEIARLSSAPDRRKLQGIRDYAIIKTFLNTGLRRQELIDLKVGDMKWDEGKCYLVVHSKGGTVDEQPLQNDRAVQAIKKYLIQSGHEKKSHEPLFQPLPTRTKAGNHKLCRRSLDSMLMKYGKMARINKRISSHMLRHTFGTQVYSMTKDLAITQRLMRHRSISSTMIYVHTDDNAVRFVLQDLNL